MFKNDLQIETPKHTKHDSELIRNTPTTVYKLKLRQAHTHKKKKKSLYIFVYTYTLPITIPVLLALDFFFSQVVIYTEQDKRVMASVNTVVCVYMRRSDRQMNGSATGEEEMRKIRT